MFHAFGMALEGFPFFNCYLYLVWQHNELMYFGPSNVLFFVKYSNSFSSLMPYPLHFKRMKNKRFEIDCYALKRLRIQKKNREEET